MRKSRDRICTSTLPSLNLTLFPTQTSRFGSRTAVPCLKPNLKWELQERKQWLWKFINSNRIRRHQVNIILLNSAPLTSGFQVACGTVPFFVYDIIQMLQPTHIGHHLIDVNCHEIIWKRKSLGTCLQPFPKFIQCKAF